MTKKGCFLQVKAFGDLVIANAAAGRVVGADRKQLTLAIGEHLVSLCEAIEPKVETLCLQTGEPGVPSIFDVRRNGWRAATVSALRLRRVVRRVPLDRSTLILMDHLNWRERFIVGGRRIAEIPRAASNIYLGYDELLRNTGFTLAAGHTSRPVRPRQVGIFPGSRNAHKDIPISLISETIHQMRRAGVSINLFLLDGERPDVVEAGLQHIMIPRNFSALREAISYVDAVISADSLPAHLAESFGKDVFVFTPVPNEFWMPRSVFTKRRWSLFVDRAGARRAVSTLIDDRV